MGHFFFQWFKWRDQNFFIGSKGGPEFFCAFGTISLLLLVKSNLFIVEPFVLEAHTMKKENIDIHVQIYLYKNEDNGEIYAVYLFPHGVQC